MKNPVTPIKVPPYPRQETLREIQATFAIASATAKAAMAQRGTNTH